MFFYSSLKELPHPNWILFFSIIINRLGNTALIFLMLYLHTQLGYSITATGAIFGVYGLGALIAGPLGGWLSDYFGVWRVMVISLCLNALVLFFYPISHSTWVIIILTLCWSLTAEIFRPANLVAVSQFCKESQRKTAYALNRVGVNLGTSIGPLLGGIVAEHHFFWVFMMSGIALIIAAIIIFNQFSHWIMKEHTSLSPTQESISTTYVNVIKDRHLRYILLLFVIIALVFFQYNSTLPLFIIQYLHMTTRFIGILFMISCIMIILFEVPLNLATSEWHFSKTMAVGAFSIALGFGGYALMTSFSGLIIATIIWTFGEMLLLPCISAYISDLAPLTQRGAYMGIFTMTLNMALTFGPFLGTKIMSGYGSKSLWVACFICGIMVATLFWQLPVKKPLKYITD